MSRYSKVSDNLRLMINLALDLCHDCTPLLTSSSLDVDVLEGVAKARYTLALTAEFMYKSTVENTEPWNDRRIKKELEHLFDATKKLCNESSNTAPKLFLLKQLARRFGVEAIHEVLHRREELEWIVRRESRDQQVKNMFNIGSITIF